ncbi:hypothetical protein [Photobacterium kishitanii]|uniref:Uncharacterized protein n=1 Tax=Photobacterium kishitanii TaxID=318456 RepID=A0A2T3KMC3_9GAMM|nr:hypothetical protein [Photobacterium kishitanii]PSV00950.1 hypothetical protein C9J27_02690 [Photobacterium kishitanii]
MITKKDFLNKFNELSDGMEKRDIGLTCAEIFYDKCASSDKGFASHVKVSSFNSSQLKKFTSKFYKIPDGKLCSLSLLDTVSWYPKVMLEALVESGLYKHSLLFISDSDCGTEYRHASTGMSQILISEYQKSIVAANKYGIPLGIGNSPLLYCVPCDALDGYDAERGRITDPYSGKDELDPLEWLYEVYEFIKGANYEVIRSENYV